MRITRQTSWKATVAATGAKVLTPSVMMWDSEDPLAVTVGFPMEEGHPEWRFARDLMDDGLETGASDTLSDVCFMYSKEDADVLYMRLIGESGSIAMIDTPASGVRIFLDETYEAVPRGSEVVDVDAVLGRLLG
jgi:sporulation and cell division protein SsgA